MIIVTGKLVEDCFDDSAIYGYEFETSWTCEAIQGLRDFGKLEYFADFPRPFFRVIGSSGLQIKGVEGETTCRVIYPRENKEVLRRQFESCFQAPPPGGCSKNQS